MIRLYHFTCNHGFNGITADGYVKPNLHPLLTFDRDLVMLGWFTDLDDPIEEVLGLTSFSLDCDRTRYKFEVNPDGAVWWPLWRRTYLKAARAKGPQAHAAASRAVHTLESAPGVLPAHWWASESRLPTFPAPSLTGD